MQWIKTARSPNSVLPERKAPKTLTTQRPQLTLLGAFCIGILFVCRAADRQRFYVSCNLPELAFY